MLSNELVCARLSQVVPPAKKMKVSSDGEDSESTNTDDSSDLDPTYDPNEEHMLTIEDVLSPSEFL